VRIVDAHTHLPGKLLGAAPRPAADLRRELEAGGVTTAWIFTTDGLLRDPAHHNGVLAAETRGHRDFFLPFCTVSPHDGAEDAITEMRRAVAEDGMRGLKFHPWLQSFSLTNPAVVPILRAAGDLGLPVLFHDGSPPYSDPLQIAWAAEQAPGTTVVLGHAGLDDLTENAIRACVRNPNVHLCICCPSCGHIGEIARRAPVERLLFGSDGGFAAGVVEWSVAKLRAVVKDEDTLAGILYRNAERLLPMRGG
jgi:uncharacterized protein